jgi:hypothetical protein
MFRFTDKTEDDKLKKLLRDSWNVKSESEKGSLLHNLKLVIPPDNPGLLFLIGRLKKQTGNGNGYAGDSLRWRSRNILSSVAAWVLVIIVITGGIYFISNIFRPSHGISGGNGEGNYGVVVDNNNLEEAEEVARYIYTFAGFRIETPKKLTLKEAIAEMERIKPQGLELHISGMKQVDEYFKDSNGVRVHFYIYELQDEKSVKKGEGAKKSGFEGN